MPLMKERKEEFSYVQFIGDSGHFLIEMKGEEHGKTLKETNKLANIDKYFKS